MDRDLSESGDGVINIEKSLKEFVNSFRQINSSLSSVLSDLFM